MADIIVIVQAIQIGGKMKSLIKKVLFGVLVLVVAIVVCVGVGYVTKNNELTREQEYASEQAQEEATGELQELKGKVETIQHLSVTDGFDSIKVQDALMQQLKDGIKEVEESDNQYLKDVSIPITESNVLSACDEAIAYINHWIEELG